MKEEWQKVKLGEMYKVHNGLSKGGKYFGSGYPFVSFSTVFNNWFIPEQIKDLVQSTEQEQENYSVKKGDVFITRTSETADELGMSCVALKDYPYATYNGFCKRLRPVNSHYAIDNKFVGYFLRTKSFRNNFLGLSGAMTTRASLKNDDLLAMEISLPPLPVQQKIASVLSAYDDLIENNRRQIKLLEEAAQKLYKEWFVKLNFPGHENTKIVDGVPEGWKREKLINLVDVQYGYAFDGAKFNSEGNGKPIIRIRNIPEGTTNDYTIEEATDDYLVHNGDIIVGMDGEFHINTWNQGDAYLVQRSCSFRPRNEKMKGYLLQAIYEPIKFFEKTVVGATVTHLGKKHIDTIEVWSCPDKFYEPFENFYKKRQVLQNQIQQLQSARDKLLPKLMNGEFEV